MRPGNGGGPAGTGPRGSSEPNEYNRAPLLVLAPDRRGLLGRVGLRRAVRIVRAMREVQRQLVGLALLRDDELRRLVEVLDANDLTPAEVERVRSADDEDLRRIVVDDWRRDGLDPAQIAAAARAWPVGVEWELTPAEVERLLAPRIDDETFLELAEHVDPILGRLWRTGDWRRLGYASPSEADFGLLSRLRHCGADRERAVRLARSSALYRPKYDERRGGETYLQRSARRIFEQGARP